MNYNQSIVKNLLKSTVESERLKLLSELKLVHSADRLFHTLMMEDDILIGNNYGNVEKKAKLYSSRSHSHTKYKTSLLKSGSQRYNKTQFL